MHAPIRAAAAQPHCHLADPHSNLTVHLELWRDAEAQGAQLTVFPELSLTGATCGDLFLEAPLLDAAEAALAELLRQSAQLHSLAVVGLPLRVGAGLYNVAAVLQSGRLLGLVPQAQPPRGRGQEAARWFRPGGELPPLYTHPALAPQGVPLGLDLLFEATGDAPARFGLSLGDDPWLPHPAHEALLAAGATLLLNPSAQPFIPGALDPLDLQGQALTARALCALITAHAGLGESTTDAVHAGYAAFYDRGERIAHRAPFTAQPGLCVADLDLAHLVPLRRQRQHHLDALQAVLRARPIRVVPLRLPPRAPDLRRGPVHPHPFLPATPAALAQRCADTFAAQSWALAARLRAIGQPKIVLGISGGLDSTQAALAAAAALDLCGRPRRDLICITLPGLGTTATTRTSAQRLSELLGADFRSYEALPELSRQVLAQVGHPAASDAPSVAALLERLRAAPELGDISFENVQARLRTLLLMTVANREGGLVLGTGDLSEKALGWSTYNGDHISMYDINASVPKTLMRLLVRWIATQRAATLARPADASSAEALREILGVILHTPISPELLPTDERGQIAQLTEAVLGPYELHDFYLYQIVHEAHAPTAALDLAWAAFAGQYTAAQLQQTMQTFLRRFFQNQFKRSCSADGPQVGPVALSPRAAWRMPSDVRAATWLRAIENWRPPAPPPPAEEPTA